MGEKKLSYRKYILLSILLFLLSISVFSAAVNYVPPLHILNKLHYQEMPYMYHFTLPNEYSNSSHAITVDDDKNLIICNLKGVMIFNGSVWSKVETPFTPYTIKKVPNKNIFYIGGEQGMGYIAKDHAGQYKFTPIEAKHTGNIYQLEITSQWIVFGSRTKIVLVSKSNNKVAQLISVKKDLFSGFFIYKDEILIFDKSKTLYTLSKGENYKLKELATDNKIEQILFFLPTTANKVLIGTMQNELLQYDGEKLTEYNIEDEKYIKHLGLTTAKQLNDNKIALGTLNGGCMIVDAITKKTHKIINYQNGLPDNETFSMFSSGSELWLSHGKGITYINLELPLKSFTPYTDLQADLFSMIHFDNTLYLTTSSGVFYLDSTFNLNDVIENYIKQNKKTLTKKKNTTNDNNIDNSTDDSIDNSTDKTINLLTFKEKWQITRQIWKNKFDTHSISKSPKTRDTTTITNTPVVNEENKVNNYYLTPNEEVYFKHTVKLLHRKIAGIDNKCTYMLQHQNFLLVASNKGLFSIKEQKSNAIIKNEYIHTLREYENKIYAGTRTGLYVVTYENYKWTAKKIEATNDIPIYSIAFKNNGTMWLGSENVAYKYTLDEKIKVYKLDNSLAGKIMVSDIKETLTFFIPKGKYIYDHNTDSILLVNNFESPNKQNFILSSNQNIWEKINSRWKTYSNNNVEDYYKYISLFENIKDIYIAPDSNIWIIQDKRIFCINTKEKSTTNNFNIYLKSIKNSNNNLLNINLNELPNDNIETSFYFSSPYYAMPSSVKYKYKLEGRMLKWKHTDIAEAIFYSLEPGDYKLHVKAYNVLGQEANFTHPFSVKRHWSQTLIFRLAVIILLLFTAVFLIRTIIKQRIKRLQLANEKLEKTVQQRTEKIEIQKKKIEAQNAELEKHKTQLEEMVQNRTSQLVAAKISAEESSKLKSEFLSNMSHEIRTPMNAIIGFSDIIKFQIKDKNCLVLLDRIMANGNNLLKIINDIIDLSFIEVNQLKLKNIPTNIPNLINDLSSQYSSLVQQKQLELNVNIDTKIPKNVLIDRQRLKQIIDYLLNNAIKFTEKGTITITTKTQDNQDETVNICIEIADTGIGITEEQSSIIFEKFRQVDGNISRKYGGLGLGLSISKALTELMEGKITFNSVVGEGSTFCIHFNQLTKLNLTETNPHIIKQTNHKILFIGQIPIDKLNLISATSNLNVEYEFITYLPKDSKKLNSFCPRIIFIDLSESYLTILDLVKSIKKNTILQSSKIVLMSAINLSSYIDAFALYIDDFLFKPITLLQIEESILKFIPTDKTHSQVQETEIQATQATAAYNQELDFPLTNELIPLFLDTFSPLYNSIIEIFDVEDVKEFAALFVSFGQNHKLAAIEEYGKQLDDLIKVYHIEEIEIMLTKLGHFIDRLKVQ